MCVFKNHAFIYFLRPPSWSGTIIFNIIFSRCFLPFDIMSHSAFIIFNIISSRHFFLFDILSRSAVITFVLMSFRHYLPFDVLSFRRFLLFDVVFVDLLSHSTFCLSTFLLSAFLLRFFVGESAPGSWQCVEYHEGEQVGWNQWWWERRPGGSEWQGIWSTRKMENKVDAKDFLAKQWDICYVDI